MNARDTPSYLRSERGGSRRWIVPCAARVKRCIYDTIRDHTPPVNIFPGRWIRRVRPGYPPLNWNTAMVYRLVERDERIHTRVGRTGPPDDVELTGDKGG